MVRGAIVSLAGLIVALCGSITLGGVGNPQIRTDHPLYPGELAYSTPERLAKTILETNWGLGLGDSPRDNALRLWLWRITHTIHDYSPRIWTPLHDYYRRKFGSRDKAHPTRPNPVSEVYSADDTDFDAMRWQFSYGYGLCGTLHGVIGPQIAAIAKVLGQDWRSRRVGIPGDSNHEIYYGGSWRAFDVNALTLLFSSDDPRTAELLPFKVAFGPKGGPKDLQCVENAPKFNGKILPKWTWSPLDKKTKKLADYNYFMKILGDPKFYWDADEVGKRKHGGPLIYNSGYIACPIVYRLKRGESFTRWFNGDDAKADMQLPKRIWWGCNLPGGPGMRRWWAHYLRDLPEYCKDTDPLIFAEDSQWNNKFSRHNPQEAIHGNGLYDWQPNLAAGDWREGAVAMDGTIESRAESPALAAATDASITLAFFSPYTIAAMPPDESDPAKDDASHGAILEADTAGDVEAEVSINNGLTFMPIGTLSGKQAQLDFTDRVKGRNQYLLRLRFRAGSGLDRLRLRTVVTTCRAVYPKLKSGSTTITYAADGLDAFEATPDFTSKPRATDPACFVKADNLEWSGYEDGQKTAWKLSKGAGSVIYKVSAPPGRKLTSVWAAAALVWPAPTRKGCWGEIAVASSPTGPWRVVGKLDAVADDLVNKNEASSVWVYGSADLAERRAGSAYVRVRFAAGDKAGGLRYLRVFGTYKAAEAAPLRITYYWKSAETLRSHTETVPAGARLHRYTIQTGPEIKNLKVVFAVPASP